MKDPKIIINQITDATGSTLVKTWQKGHDGPEKKGGGQMVAGKVKTLKLKLSKYLELAMQSRPDQFIVTSTCRYEKQTAVVAKSRVDDFIHLTGSEGSFDIVTRTKDVMTYAADEPGLLVFDHDYNERCTAKLTDPDGLVSILDQTFPKVFGENTAHAAYYSSSSFIYDGDEQVTGPRGFHVGYAVQDSSDIPRFRDALFGHLWLKGYGYLAISKDGKALPRTVFDKIAIQAQQPIFTNVKCEDGLVQQRPDPVFNTGGYLNTRALPSLTPDEKNEFDRLVDEAKISAEKDITATRRKYVKDAGRQLVKDTEARGEKMTQRRAERVVESRIGGTLVGSDQLRFDGGKVVTVAEVLADPAQWDGKTLADPIEPEYGGGRGKAIFYANDDTENPLIFSHAHWGRLFHMKFDHVSALALIDTLDDSDLREAWTDIVIQAELREDEAEDFIEKVKERIGGTKPVLIKTLKRARATLVERRGGLEVDPADFLVDKILKDEYRNGRHLIQTAERIFWVYTGTHWVKVADRVLEGELQRLARFNWSVVKAMAGEKANPKLAEVVTSALTVLGRRVVRDGDPLRMTSPQPAVINCLNGEVWLEADGAKLRAHDPESFLTSCSRIVYDPIAKAPTYARLIETMFCEPGGEPLPDQTDIARHITEMMGYAIQPVRNLKVFYLFVGDGDNGKSQLIKLYSYIVGDDAALWTRLDGIENDTNKSIGLLGKKAVIDDDASRDFLLPDGFIKRVAEEKIISSRYLFKDMVNFVAAVVPIIMGNHWPRSRDLTRGMRTRTAVVKFPRSFLKLGELDEDHKVVDADHPDVQRPDLWEQVYKEELPGVVNDWIEGYYRLKERGAFDVPASCNKAFNMWLSMANPVSRFVEECLIPGDLQKDMMHATKDLYRAYQHWAEGEGIPARFVAEKNTFRSHLADMGCKVKRREDGWHLFGYKPSDNLALFHSVNLVDEDGERIVSDREAKAEEWREENLVATDRKFAAVK